MQHDVRTGALVLLVRGGRGSPVWLRPIVTVMPMPNRRLPRPAKIHSLKVVLEGTNPQVWRRLLLRSHSTLAQLHQILQVAMGWEDCHLHQFRVDSVTYAPSRLGDGRQPKEESRARLSAVAPPGTWFVYEYDFGDGWEHTIEVEKVVPAGDGRLYPSCVDGARACPPEDCGGWRGYTELLDTLKSSDSHKRDELLEWLGAEFDPDRFDLAVVNAALSSLSGGTSHTRPKRTAIGANT